MQNVKQGQFERFDASQWRVGIVVAQFNRDITDALLTSARQMAKEYKIADAKLEVYKVAGSVEIPVVLRAMVKSKKYAKKYDCLVALGAVIRGETPHFDYVAKMASEGIQDVMKEGIPIGFGVLTCNTHEQALARINAGGAALEAALQAAKVIKEI